jgi:hypothetical protein
VNHLYGRDLRNAVLAVLVILMAIPAVSKVIELSTQQSDASTWKQDRIVGVRRVLMPHDGCFVLMCLDEETREITFVEMPKEAEVKFYHDRRPSEPMYADVWTGRRGTQADAIMRAIVHLSDYTLLTVNVGSIESNIEDMQTPESERRPGLTEAYPKKAVYDP